MDSQTPAPAPQSGHSSHWVAYILGWISGFLVFLTAKDEESRFHGAQSIVVFGGLHILQIILSNLFFYGPMGYGSVGSVFRLLQLVTIGLLIWLIYQSLQPGRYKLPVVGDWAEKMAKK